MAYRPRTNLMKTAKTPKASTEPKLCSTLIEILVHGRAHESAGDLKFRKWLTEKLPSGTWLTTSASAFYVEVGDNPSVAFSCHIDTCDSPTTLSKKIVYDPFIGIISLDSEDKASCLGADDGVGIWLMINMIEANVPGGYLFHTGEECGGLGSRALMSKSPDFLRKFTRIIAFDRPHETEVITHQGGQRCASDEFSTALCRALNQHGLNYSLSDRGVFTDTKVYRGAIAECSNIGVGYDAQHSPNETLNYWHAIQLRDACLNIDWHALPVKRDHTKPDPAPATSLRPYTFQPAPKYADYDYADYDLDSMTLHEMEDWCATDPEAAASAIVELQADVASLKAANELFRRVLGLDR